MRRETLVTPVTQVPAEPDYITMEEDEKEQLAYYEQFTGRSGNWELNQKPRCFHQPGKLLAGVFYNLVCWLSLAALLFVGYKFNETNDRTWMVYALMALVAFIFAQIARYSNGQSTHCPLCHGTPLFEKRCRKHRSANKFLFFGHRASTVLSILARGKFNCMYCGTPFRVKK